MLKMLKIGLGEDSHQFSEDPEKKLILGGLEIPGSPGLLANSDGDVILHALCNAFDICANLGSIANYADGMLTTGIKDSRKYLNFANKKAREKGWRITGLSISLEAQKPKLESFLPEIKKRLAALLNLSSNDIGLTVTSGEALTSFGKGEGIKATAIVVFEE